MYMYIYIYMYTYTSQVGSITICIQATYDLYNYLYTAVLKYRGAQGPAGGRGGGDA